jgi:acyl-CoA synthetase (AMP-forming)/AMP-acid ligase II
MSTIPGILFAQAIKQPNALAIEDLGWRLSYAELAEKVRKAAAVLSEMGLSRGDKFAIWAPNCAEWIISALAGQAVGAVLVTLNTRYKVLKLRKF